MLGNSPVLLLRSKDSVLIRHTRTDKSGNFILSGVSPGQYLLLVTYPRYADYVDELNIKDSSILVLPTIGLMMKSKLLEQVVVSGNKGAIHIKGDTVEFRADSFKTQAGATVEDLLKKLPGIQVDRNGKITAQGQTVQKVLVDGEEFFGDDPTLVTQNLRADMVDKVQLYDKKSDQAAFTGIDDGQKTKTINLKLKDDKKAGYFGKISGGTGTDGFYDAQAMINMFRKKKKIAAYGIMSNTGKTGLNWSERDNYGQSFAGAIDYDETLGNYTFNGSNDDELTSWSGRYEGQGLPSVKTGGIHYNDKWNEERQSFNANYKFMQLRVNDSSSNNTQYILPDSLYASNPLYYNNQESRSKKDITRHSFDGSYEIKFDSTSTLKIMADGGSDHKTTNSLTTSQALARDSSLINDNRRQTSSVGDNRVVNSNILWRKKLAKKGRTISMNLRENYTNTSSTGFLNSDTRFYDQGVFSRDSLIDQYKDYHNTTTLLDGKLTYTEPLSKFSFLIVNYGAAFSYNHSNRNSFNKGGNGKYGQLDSLYSNDYQFDVFTHKGGLAYSIIKKKIRVNAGSNIGFTSFDQKDLHADTLVKRNFVNWYPQASLTYSFAQQRRLWFSYNGSTSQPSIQQIQPTRTNDDPLNIVLGNPALKQQFANNFNLNFNDYKVLTQRYIWVSVDYSFTKNAISNSVNLDATGKRTTQSINVNGNHNFSASINYDFKWNGPAINVGFFGSTRQNSNVSVVNSLPNTTNSGSYEFGAGLNKSKEKVYDVNIRGSATYTRSKSSLNEAVTTQYWTYSINPGMDIFLPLKFQIHADCDISLRQKTLQFQNRNNTALLSAWIGKKFLKNDVLQFRAAGNDLLNQNIGFNRTVNSNFISQNTYNTIKRYFMFSVVWNFTKAGTSAPARQ